MAQVSPFIQYCNELYEKFKNPETAPVGTVEPVNFMHLIAQASVEERDKMGSLLIAEAVKQGENRENIEREWQGLVEAALNDKVMEAQTPELPNDDIYSHIFHKPPHYDIAQYNPPKVSKHQCTRKPKPRKNTKHGNRKRK